MEHHECSCTGKTLARLVHPAVLAVLAKEPLHGYRIIQRLSAMHAFGGQTPDPTGVYRMLKAMEREGLVEACWQLAGTGPAKRQFALTEAGRDCLERWGQTLQAYEATIAEVLAVIRQATGGKGGVSRPRKRSLECVCTATCCGKVSPK